MNRILNTTMAIVICMTYSNSNANTKTTNSEKSFFINSSYISNNQILPPQVYLVSNCEQQIELEFTLNGFDCMNVLTPKGIQQIISVPKMAPMLIANAPDLPQIPIPVIIGDCAEMEVCITQSEHTDYQNIEIAPSKGNFSRQINPNSIPYSYGEAYNQNAFYPSSQAYLEEPYIIRDIRGQNIMVRPFAYNPVTKTLRVYHHLSISIYETSKDGMNPKIHRKNVTKVDPEIQQAYRRRFINYRENEAKFNFIEDRGELLIICADQFMLGMEEFVAWKNQSGRPTTVVSVSEVGGNNDTQIKSYIQSIYTNPERNLQFVLFVGDYEHITPHAVSGERSDNWFGQLEGNDHYDEVFIGRFSVQTNAHLANHVNKVLYYERDMPEGLTWVNKGLGIGQIGSGSGHYGEGDYQHIDFIRDTLEHYTYEHVTELHGGDGASTSSISNTINQGISIINYCNTGTETNWAVANYNNNDVNSLTNDYKWPFIWSVGCLSGKFNYGGANGECFAEAWMRANDNSTGVPTGAIGGMFSWISLPWIPPMYGQDEMVDILCEWCSVDRFYHTLGGASVNGNQYVLDMTGSQGYDTHDMWILFGDPSLMVRTDNPVRMNTSYNPSTLLIGMSNIEINANNTPYGIATLSMNGETIATGNIINGTCILSFAPLNNAGVATLTVMGFNKVTEIIEITINSVAEVLITATANPTNGGTVTGGGIYAQGSTCTLLATANSGYSFVRWTKNGTQVSTNPTYSFTVTGNAAYVAHFEQNPTTYTVTATASPTGSGFVEGQGTYVQGSTCTLSATPNGNYSFEKWVKDGTQVSTNPTYSFTVTSNANCTAYFVPTYTITATANPTTGGSVTGGGTYAQGSTCILHATPNNGYSFVNWTKNGVQVSTNLDYNFTVTGSEAFVANFERDPVEYTITVNADPAAGGTVSGGGTYTEGSTCVISAMPNTGYVFERWTRNDIVVSTNPTHTITVERNATFVAHFTQNTNQATITAMADPVEGGSVSGGGTYELGATCTLNAVAATDYEFVKWSKDGSTVSTETSFSFPVTSNAVYVAHFNKLVNNYTVSVSLEPSQSAGSVIGAGTYEEGASCTLIAIANPTYSFVSWTENGAVVSTDDHFTFTVERNRSLVAVFSQGLFYTITASAEPNGTITPEGEIIVEPGQDKAFTIIPNEGCRVSKVLINGVDMGPLESYNFRNVHENGSIYAQFSGLGVDDNITLDLKVYPNPANNIINVESQNMKRVSIFNLYGVQIESKDVNDDRAIFSTDNLSQGTYILKVESQDGRIGYTRFILMK